MPCTKTNARYPDERGSGPARPGGPRQSASAGPRNDRRASAGYGYSRAAALLLSSLLAVALVVLLPGCGSNGVIQYNKVANQVLESVNTKEGELKKYWTLPLSEQDTMAQTLASLRKALASSQQLLDSTDRPEPSRQLDDLLGRAVDESRTLADISTQFADYLGQVAPIAKGASDIVTMLQGLEKSQDVPSSVAGLAEKARTLETQARAVQPSPTFVDEHAELQAFLTLLVANLDNAQKKLAEIQTGSTPSGNDNGDTSPEGQTAADRASQRATKRQVDAISPYTDTIIEAWGQMNGKVSALLDEARATTGLKAKTAEVEGYIGQAVQQIQSLEKKYK